VAHERSRVAGVGSRFADAQHEACRKQGRERVQAASGGRRARPNKKTNGHHPFGVEAVRQPAGNRKKERVGPEKEDSRIPSCEADRFQFVLQQ